MANNTVKPKRTVYTVSRLNQDVNALLTSNLGVLWVEGEISNFTKPASGHYYFSIKDSRSQLRCAMFRGRNQYLKFTPENGQQVLLRGKPGVYEARGDFQFIADHMEIEGSGELQRQFEETRIRLEAEGLFDETTKKKLPKWPGSIGLITSPTGAALRDILQVLSRRYPSAQVIIYPTQVQGQAAVPQICGAIACATSRREVDVLLLARGGGSLEDLWAFNDESVVRAIHQCPIPLVCGVGHEIDFTISDYVADLRAPTPSAAAEIATPDTPEVQQFLSGMIESLYRAVQVKLQPTSTLMTQLTSRLMARHPERVLAQHFQKADDLEDRLNRLIVAVLSNRRQRVQNSVSRLLSQSPTRHINVKRGALQAAEKTLRNSIKSVLDAQTAALANSSHALDTVSPLATLGRGYAVVRHKNSILTSAEGLQAGDEIEAQLAQGSIQASVIEAICLENELSD